MFEVLFQLGCTARNKGLGKTVISVGIIWDFPLRLKIIPHADFAMGSVGHANSLHSTENCLVWKLFHVSCASYITTLLKMPMKSPWNLMCSPPNLVFVYIFFLFSPLLSQNKSMSTFIGLVLMLNGLTKHMQLNQASHNPHDGRSFPSCIQWLRLYPPVSSSLAWVCCFLIVIKQWNLLTVLPGLIQLELCNLLVMECEYCRPINQHLISGLY